MVHGEDAGGQQDAQRRQRLRPPAAAQFAGQRAGQQHQAGAGQRGQQTDCRERIAQGEADQLGRQRDQRRLVHIPPVEMLRACQVIQFVDEITVVTAGIEVD